VLITLTDNLTHLRRLRELSNIDISPYADDNNAINQNSPEFAHEQKTDPTLQHLWIEAQTGSSEVSVIEGLLYRKVTVNISSMHVGFDSHGA